MPDREGHINSKRPYVVIVQPYVPTYRVEFFSRLIRVLNENGIDCVVAAGQPKSEQLQRGDVATEEWMRSFKQKSISCFGRTVGLGGARETWAHADVVIIGHLGSSLDTYLALWDAIRGKIKVGLWGHIKSYVNKGVPIDIALEKWQLRRADHVFAYVPSGRRYAISNGVQPQNVTTVMNTVDTTRLVESRDAISKYTVTSFAEKHRLVEGRVLGYLGGLDASKRIDFLVSTLDHLWVTDPDIKILIGGRGAQSELLNEAVLREQVVMMGFVGPEEQALLGKLSEALLMPGRVGLVAVDALVLGIPVLTTNWPYHAPEIEYLTEGHSKFTSANDPAAYAELIRRVLSGSGVDTADPSTYEDGPPLIEDMVKNFAQGVVQLVQAKKRRSGLRRRSGGNVAGPSCQRK